MSEYLVRKGKLFYEIAKFQNTRDPVSLYIFTQRGCSCPAGRRSCKHVKILNAWKKAGEVPGQVYDDEAILLHTLSVTT